MRGRKKKVEKKKPSPEERLAQLWEQQEFLLNKMYPMSAKQLLEIKRRYASGEKQAIFQPTEDALRELTALYVDLKSSAPASVV